MEDKVSDTLLQREYAKQQEKIAKLEAQFFTLGGDIGESKADTEPMTTSTDYRHELQLRDEQLRRDIAAQRELIDERMKGLDDRMRAFMDVQFERDKRIEDIAVRATDAAESAATVKSNYWAAVGVQLLAVAAILVGAYFATQANTLSAISTTLSAFQAGKVESTSATPLPPQQMPAK